jgi:hypothetical protein
LNEALECPWPRFKVKARFTPESIAEAREAIKGRRASGRVVSSIRAGGPAASRAIPVARQSTGSDQIDDERRRRHRPDEESVRVDTRPAAVEDSGMVTRRFAPKRTPSFVIPGDIAGQRTIDRIDETSPHFHCIAETRCGVPERRTPTRRGVARCRGG